MEISPFLSFSFLLLALPCDGGQFWHISDLHLDYEYTKGGNITNWCHKAVDKGTISLNSAIVGPAGNYRCDSPAALVESALLAMKRFKYDPDFIVWTGDSAPHWRNPSPPNEEYILNVTKHVFTRLDKLFPKVPIIPALGNHDASPPDQFPLSDPEEKKKPAYYKKLWQSGAFGDHINAEAMETFQQCGFYSKVVSPSNSAKKLKFIVLNTNIYYHDNFTTGPDPCGQLDWLNKTLTNTDIVKEKVFIVAHVSPGSFERKTGQPNFNSPEEYKTPINKQYIQIVTDPRNAGKISAHLYGHLHTDTFRVLLDRATRMKAVGVAFMAGSVTPVVWGKDGVVGVNPTVRLMDYNDTDARVSDYKEYSLDIVKAAKNETSTETVKPKSRRKNTKFLKNQDDENVGRSRRESLDAENPADDDSISLDSSTITTTVPSKLLADKVTTVTAAPTVKSTGQFTTIIAVPSTTAPEAVGGNAITDVPVVTANNSSLNTTDAIADVATVSPSAVNDAEEVVKSTQAIASTESSALATEDGSLNQTDANITEVEPDYPTYLSTQWTLLYIASTSFSVPDLSPTSMFQALKMMVSGGHNSSVFVNYYEHNTGGHLVEKCNETCWREQLCTVSNLVMEELATCLNSTGEEGFYEVHTTNPAPEIPTTTMPRKGFGEGGDDPDNAVHGDKDHSHDHNNDGVEDHEHEEHSDSIHNEDDQFHDHNKDGVADHDHKDHADHFPVAEGKEDVSKEKLEDPTSNISSRAVAIFFGVFAVAIVALAAAMGYKKYRDNRYRNQEFLLTDAVFRYDGYSQLDDA